MKRYTGDGDDVPDKCFIFVEPFNPLAAGDTKSDDTRDSASAYVCNVEDISLPTVFETKQEKGGFTLKSIANRMDTSNDHSEWGVGWCVYFHPLV